MGRHIKYTYSDVKQIVENRGYTLLSDNYLKTRDKIVFQDLNGFIYEMVFYNFIRSNPSKFEKSNSYTIYNIKLWCKVNNKPFKLISTEYNSEKENLVWECLNSNCKSVFYTHLSSIINMNCGCSYCSGHKVNLTNCLATKNPELAKEWHPTLNGEFTPYDVTCGSHKKIWWLCNNNHIWQASIKDRYKGNGCPYCSGFFASKDRNLLIHNPMLCNEWNYNKNQLLPENYLPYSNKKVWWICEKGHEWQATILARNKDGNNCPYCTGKLPTKENNLLIHNPILCIEWNYQRNKKEPNECTPNSKKKVWWVCKKCGYEWQATIRNRNALSSGCPVCTLSKGESKIEKWLKTNDVSYIPQKEFDGLIGLGYGNLSYDFYLPDYNLLIEYQGQQHKKPIDFEGKGEKYANKQFFKQQEHDKRKKQYAIENNIDLLEIWYWDFDNIEEILKKKLK